jgi:hypothetical protein
MVDRILGEAAANSLLEAATACAVDAQMLREDMANLLFPHSASAPSEAQQAAVKLTLQELVAGVERRLHVDADPAAEPSSWAMLARSGLLREPALIEFCMARIAEAAMQQRLDDAGVEFLEQLPVTCLGADDPIVAEVAKKYLSAASLLQTGSAEALVAQLPAELLHMLMWRVVAVFQTRTGTAAPDVPDLATRARNMFAQHDEAQSLQSCAVKLAYFLPEALQPQLRHPEKAGLALFAAGLAHEFRMSYDRVLRLLDEASVAPLLAMQRACGIEQDQAISQILLIRGQRKEDQALAGFLADYEQLEPAMARQTIMDWRFGQYSAVDIG